MISPRMRGGVTALKVEKLEPELDRKHMRKYPHSLPPPRKGEGRRPSMRILLLAALALTACSTPEPAAPAKPQGAVAAPAPVGALRITSADAGKTIAAPVGGKISLELVGIPTAGYLWSVVEKPAFLTEAGTMGGPTSAAQKQPGFAGGSHWEVFVFDVQGAGKSALKLEQRRPWEKTEPPSATFEVVIEAR